MHRKEPQQIDYIDRATGVRWQEVIYGAAELRFLYYHPVGRLLRLLIARQPWFSRLNGWFKRRPGSRRRIAAFIERYQVNAAEAEKPVHQYISLDDFFSRRLRSGARPICRDERALLAPADGRVLACPLQPNTHFAIKDQRVTVAELLRDQDVAQRLDGGWALVVRLAPKDYHRFHFPADGFAGPARAIAGLLESVHPLALAAGARSFANRRQVTQLQTRWGLVVMVEVGALTIGTIEQTYQPGPVRRGDEKGLFRFGGSTVVLLWGRDGPQVDADLQANSAAGLETLVNFGTRVAAFHD